MCGNGCVGAFDCMLVGAFECMLVNCVRADICRVGLS